MALMERKKKPIREFLGERKTLLSDRPRMFKTGGEIEILGNPLKELGNPLKFESMFKNTMWEEMERKKRSEWAGRGYSEHLIDMAVDLAHSYATGISPWVSEVSGVPRVEIEKKLFEYGLSTVGERWIKTMAK